MYCRIRRNGAFSLGQGVVQALIPRWMDPERRARAIKMGGAHAKHEMEGTVYSDSSCVFADDVVNALFTGVKFRPMVPPSVYIIAIDPGDPQPGSCYGLVGLYCQTRLVSAVPTVERIVIKTVDQFSYRRAHEACAPILYHIRQARKLWPNITIFITIECANNSLCQEWIVFSSQPEIAETLADVHLCWENFTKQYIDNFGCPGPGVYPNSVHIDEAMLNLIKFFDSRLIHFDETPFLPHGPPDTDVRELYTLIDREFMDQLNNYKRTFPKGSVGLKRPTYGGKTRDGEKDDLVAALRVGMMGIIAILCAAEKAPRRGIHGQDQAIVMDHVFARFFGKTSLVKPKTPVQIYDACKKIASGPLQYLPF